MDIESNIENLLLIPEEKNSKTITPSLIISLIEKNLNLPTYDLTDGEKKWIEVIINSSSSFDEIDEFLEPIMTSGQLNIQLIPKLIKLLADNFYTISRENNNFNYNYILTFIKFTSDIIINFVSLTVFEEFLIKSLVESSILLLKTNMDERQINLESKNTTQNNEELKINLFENDQSENIDELSKTDLPINPIANNSEVKEENETILIVKQIISSALDEFPIELKKKTNCCWNFKLF